MVPFKSCPEIIIQGYVSKSQDTFYREEVDASGPIQELSKI